ncbi:hypothetical protein [Saccharomonospora sp.]|uniref:hypothetical protein n=1 Tax=Saccharomonospora sp. TaxID=33913 RepID=UPI00261E4578|nr:hypothetical protein [Saccharomonospora sp.]
MTTADPEDLAEQVAQQLAAVVIAALRPDTTPPETGLDPVSIGEAADRLGGELVALLRQLECRPTRSDDTLPGISRGDSAVARAAHLSAQIMLSGMSDSGDAD